MTRRNKLRLVLAGGLLLVGCPCGFFGWWFAVSFGSDSGSPKLAEEWRATLVPIHDPDEAAARVPHVQIIRFPDGEWVVGLSANSHGIWVRGGGTVVVKDSRGQVRAFFGHVCGSGMLKGAFGSTKSLDEFYKQLEGSGTFVEHRFS
jgi:hypothetical protein